MRARCAAVGFSASATTRGSSSAIGVAEAIARCGTTPSSRAIASCAALSSKRSSSNPTPNACSDPRSTVDEAIAAITDESRPPLRYVATGTSARRRSRVASREQVVQLVDELSSAGAGSGAKSMSHQRSCRWTPSSPTISESGREAARGCRRTPSGRQRRPQRERVDDPDRVELAPRGGVAQQRLGLRGEAEIAAAVRQEQRPDAEAVAREQQRRASRDPRARSRSRRSGGRGSRLPIPRTRGR